ncbi:MAG: hypothetical protein H0W66_00975 [Chthoniobacterales bacterium]|nr:hypothetical protein [Chthoniobacterales bacterium]
MDWLLPTFEEAEADCRAGHPSLLHRFIYDNEPCNAEDAKEWRESLSAVLSDLAGPTANPAAIQDALACVAHICHGRSRAQNDENCS